MKFTSSDLKLMCFSNLNQIIDRTPLCPSDYFYRIDSGNQCHARTDFGRALARPAMISAWHPARSEHG
jgi:hypothetical protein